MVSTLIWPVAVLFASWPLGIAMSSFAGDIIVECIVSVSVTVPISPCTSLRSLILNLFNKITENTAVMFASEQRSTSPIASAVKANISIKLIVSTAKVAGTVTIRNILNTKLNRLRIRFSKG